MKKSVQVVGENRKPIDALPSIRPQKLSKLNALPAKQTGSLEFPPRSTPVPKPSGCATKAGTSSRRKANSPSLPTIPTPSAGPSPRPRARSNQRPPPTDAAAAPEVETFPPLEATRSPQSNVWAPSAVEPLCLPKAMFPAPPTKGSPEAGNPLPPAQAIPRSKPPVPASALADPILALLAAELYDFEKVRIASANRIRQLKQSPDDAESPGFGLAADSPIVASLQGILDGLESLESAAELEMVRRLRGHPLYGWVQANKGVGSKTAARLLGVLGDPYWNTLHGRPRLVSELWAYCGLHGPHGRRQRGIKSNWNAEAKMRTFLIAETCLRLDGQPDKNGKARALSPYRAVYDAAKVKYAEAIHATPCVRCGPSGKPAIEGSPWSKGHQHGAAMRLVMKAILRDLWLQAKAIHGAKP